MIRRIIDIYVPVICIPAPMGPGGAGVGVVLVLHLTVTILARLLAVLIMRKSSQWILSYPIKV